MTSNPTLSNYSKIIDISQPVGAKTACFPGDTPFSRNVTLTVEQSGCVNLTSLTMSPHVGTHADSPVHIKGDLQDLSAGMASHLPLEAYLGPCRVIDLAPLHDGITAKHFLEKIASIEELPPRVLFKTRHQIRYQVWEDDYAYLTVELVAALHERGVKLTGLDTPSVDHVDSKTLETHNKLDKCGLVWLENLDLSDVMEGNYFLVALPLKFTELEASPVRAVLLA
ncbi:MAG: cyclase family protein [Candidatus Melainabacteria bacterium]|nr:cyclase family protein [Candidatus Melainabacteria bacterium]